MRVACLLVPDLPLAAELRAQPELVGRPVALAAGPEPRAELVSVSPEAARRGVRAGHSAAQGRSVCAELAVRVLSPALERAARDALLDVALSAAPRAAAAPRAGGALRAEAAVYADASGVRALFASEAGFAGALAERAARLGLPGVVAVASCLEVALLGARTLVCRNADLPEAHAASRGAARGVPEGAVRGVPEGAVRVVPEGAEAAFLAPLPLDLVDADDRLAAALSRFGVSRLGEVAALPRRALATRLGAGALRLADLARGRGSALPPAPPPSPRMREGVDLEHAVDRLEPLAFVLRGALSRLAERLAVRGLACGDLELELHLAGGGRDVRRVGLASATGDVRVLVRLVGLALEARPPGAPVEALHVATEGRPPRRDQLDLFRPAGPAPAVLDRTLAELEALCGEGRIGAPSPADDHRPDAFVLGPFAPRPPGADAADPRDAAPAPGSPGAGAGPLALRALRPPVRARVEVRGGRPAWVESAVVRGAVRVASGPWRTSGAWWSPEARFAFEHYDVATSDGAVARLRYDALERTWCVDAVYD